MENPRDLCVRKNVSMERNIKRIPIIVNLIYNLWAEYKKTNYTLGFFYITNLLDSKAKDNNEDSFYWEEDKWYDFIKEEINYAKEFTKDYKLSLENEKEMKEVLDAFTNYWLHFSDLRFQQIIDMFNKDFGEFIEEYEGVCDSKFYKYFFFLKIKQLLEYRIKNLTNDKEKLFFGVEKDFNDGFIEEETLISLKDIYGEKLEKYIENIKEELKELNNG